MDFQIFGPKLGLAENTPGIALREAFIRKGSENVIERYGEYRCIRGRLADFYDITNSAQIATPTDVFAITGINTGTKTITITGDHSGGNTALSVGDTIRINGGTTTANNVELTVSSLPTTSTIVVTESLSAAGAAKGNVFIGTTPIIRYHRNPKRATGAEYILVATAYNIFLWTYTDRSLAVKFTCSAACERWEIVTHLDNVYATNNVDKVQWWNVSSSPSNDFAVCDNASGIDIDDGTTFIVQAKHIFSLESTLFLGYLTDSNGNVHPQRVIGCAIDTGGATIDFQYDVTTSQAWKKDFNNTPAFLRGFGQWGNNIIVGTGPDAKTGRIYRGWKTTADTVFEWAEESLKVGILSGDTFVNSKDGRLFFLAADMTIRELHNPIPISDNIEKTIRGINTSFCEFAQATFIDKYNSIALALPIGSSSTNNKLLIINVDKRTWFKQEIAVRAFGDYTQQVVYGYDTLPYRTYDDWGASWLIYDTDVNVAGFPLDVCSDYSGKTYDMFRADKDAGNAFTGNLIIGTSLDTQRQTLHRFKRINNGIYLYFNREAGGSVSLENKRDSESNWQVLGSVSLADESLPEIVVKYVPCDTRAKFFEFQISSEDYFEFLGMSFPEFELEGIR